MKYYLTLCLALALFACHKDSSKPAPPTTKEKEVALFNITSVCFEPTYNPGFLADSTLICYNQSSLLDTTDPKHLPTITYHWDFGDQATSNDVSPTHKYSLPGTYTVTLITYLNGEPSDTISHSFQIIRGLREFQEDVNTYAIDLDQANQKGALVLYASDPGGSSRSFGFLGIDSLLHTKWTKPIPGDDNTVRLSSMKRLNANAYILSGNYSSGNTNAFCLSEVDSTGNLIWMKYLDTLNGPNTYTLPVSDGGFLTTGTVTIANRYYTAVVKCDANGTEIWKKVFDSTLSLFGIQNIVETPNGYFFASLSTAISPDIVLTQLDFNGNIKNRQSIQPGMVVTSGTAGLLYNNNSFLVYTANGAETNYIYLFDNNLSYTGSQYTNAGIGTVKGGLTESNYFVVWTAENQYAFLHQLTPNGVPGWEYTIDPSINTSCSSTFVGATRSCKDAVYTTGNEVIVLADGQNINNNQSIYVAKLTPDGKLE